MYRPYNCSTNVQLCGAAVMIIEIRGVNEQIRTRYQNMHLKTSYLKPLYIIDPMKTKSNGLGWPMQSCSPIQLATRPDGTLNTVHQTDRDSDLILMQILCSWSHQRSEYGDLRFMWLETELGVKGIALSWLQSYSTDQSQLVKLGRHYSKTVTCNSGVPQ